MIRTALDSPNLLCIEVNTLLQILLSDPSGKSATINDCCRARASSASLSPMALACTINPLDISLCAFFIRSFNAAMRSRILCFTDALIVAASTSLLNTLMLLPFWLPDNNDHWSRSANCSRVTSCACNSLPYRNAASAASDVNARMRRTPLATAVSSTRANARASEVLVKCVPPQNSMLYALQALFSGSDTKSDTGCPMLITRTGSGYTSPNTARNE
mmetsp:Transcript_11522/g.19745  ORF Transcript_11522/g.19745 Transcript_11522/m.19745 type:complete len:217 (+) Transcript_11522:31-681(+)